MKKKIITNQIIFFVIIAFLSSCSYIDEEQHKLIKPKIDWKKGDIKSILIENEWQITSEGNIKDNGLYGDNFEIHVLNKFRDIYEIEITHQFDSITPNSLMSNYLTKSKEHPNMYLRADWQESFVKLFSKFKVYYNYKTGNLKLRNTPDFFRKTYLDKLMNLAIDYDYTLKDWKKIQDYISQNLDNEKDILNKIIPVSFDLIFDFYQLKYTINEEHKFNDETHLFADVMDRPIDLSIKHEQSDNTFKISIKNIDLIKKINEANIPVTRNIKPPKGDNSRWTVTQIDTTSNTKFKYNTNTTWLESVKVSLIKNDLFNGNQRKNVITISVQ